VAVSEIHTHTFRTKRWKLIDTGSEGAKQGGGLCEAPHNPHREMLLPMSGETLHDLDTCIHEGLHACLWDLDEEAVHETATDIARLLWRLGYRRDP
jgi:hypothetical protein